MVVCMLYGQPKSEFGLSQFGFNFGGTKTRDSSWDLIDTLTLYSGFSIGIKGQSDDNVWDIMISENGSDIDNG